MLRSVLERFDVALFWIVGLLAVSLLFVFAGVGAEQPCNDYNTAADNASSEQLSVTDSTTSGIRDAHSVEMLDGEHAIVADRNGDGVAIYEVSKQGDLSLLDRKTHSRYLNDVHYVDVGPNGDYAYLGAFRYFTVVDVSDRQSAEIVGHVRVGKGNQEPLVLNESVAALAGSTADTVYTVDISEPTDPTVLDSVGDGGDPYHMDGVRHLASRNGTLFYTADVHDEHFGALNVTDPSDIRLRDVTEVDPTVNGNDPHEVVINRDYAYVADMQADDVNGWEDGDADKHGALHVYDISNTSHLRRTTTIAEQTRSGAYLDDLHGLSLDSERDLLLASAQSHAMCSADSCGVNVFDISDPSNPVLVDALKADAWIGPAQEVAFHGGLVLTVSHENTDSCQGVTAYTYDPPS